MGIRLTLFILILAGASFIFESCCSTKKYPKPVVIRENRKLVDRTADELLSIINDSSFRASTLSGKAEVETDIDGKSNSFDITIRTRKDSVIWISISPLLGIEVSRVLITRDSVKFMDRVHKKYRLSDFNFLNNLLRMNIDFDIVQGVLSGNIFAYKKNKFNSVYIEENKFYILSTLSKHKLKRSLEEKDPNKPVIQDMYVDDSNFRIIRLFIEDDRIKKSLTTDYEDFRITEAGQFPFRSQTKIKAEKEVNIKINYTRISLNAEMDFPFTIPGSYDRLR